MLCRRDGSNEGSQICFYGIIWNNKYPKNYPYYPFLSGGSHIGNYITGS